MVQGLSTLIRLASAAKANPAATKPKLRITNTQKSSLPFLISHSFSFSFPLCLQNCVLKSSDTNSFPFQLQTRNFNLFLSQQPLYTSIPSQQSSINLLCNAHIGNCSVVLGAAEATRPAAVAAHLGLGTSQSPLCPSFCPPFFPQNIRKRAKAAHLFFGAHVGTFTCCRFRQMKILSFL